MTIKKAIESGQLPNIPEERYIAICKTLGIPADSLDYELQPGEFERLKYNSKIHNYYASERARKAHEKLISNYDKLINDYEDLIGEMEGNEELDPDREQIEELLDKLVEVRNGYNEQAKKVNVDITNMNLDKKVLNKFQETRLNVLSGRQEKVDKKLQKQYQSIDDLKSVEFQTKFMQNKQKRDIKRVQDRINRLQKKQGRLQNTQQRIINKGTDKYKKIKDKELGTYARGIEETAVNAVHMQENREMQAAYTHDMEANKELIGEQSKKTGLFNKFKTARMEARQKKMEKRLNHLKGQENVMKYLRESSKNINCRDFGEKVFRTIARGYAYHVR
jgi:DNA repair exonuclease SbcCD ATPase subunit